MQHSTTCILLLARTKVRTSLIRVGDSTPFQQMILHRFQGAYLRAQVRPYSMDCVPVPIQRGNKGITF